MKVNEDHFVQFVADNVDHNIATIDRHNTFHGMEIISTVSPKTEHRRIISSKDIPTEELVELGKINNHFYKQQNKELESMVFRQQYQDT